jgi:hypothetical protein
MASTKHGVMTLSQILGIHQNVEIYEVSREKNNSNFKLVAAL